MFLGYINVTLGTIKLETISDNLDIDQPLSERRNLKLSKKTDVIITWHFL